MREVVDEPLSKRVGDHDEDGRDRVVRTPQCGNRRAALHDQHVRPKRNHFCGVAFIELGVAARPAPIDVYVLTLAPAQRGETPRQYRRKQLPGGIVGGVIREHTEAADAGALLRRRRKRPCGRASDKAKKSSSLHRPLKSPPPAIAYRTESMMRHTFQRTNL